MKTLSHVGSLRLAKSPLLQNMETTRTRCGCLHLRSPGTLPAPCLTLRHVVLPFVCRLGDSRVRREIIPVGKVKSPFRPRTGETKARLLRFAACFSAPARPRAPLAGRDSDAQKSAVGQTPRCTPGHPGGMLASAGRRGDDPLIVLSVP